MRLRRTDRIVFPLKAFFWLILVPWRYLLVRVRFLETLALFSLLHRRVEVLIKTNLRYNFSTHSVISVFTVFLGRPILASFFPSFDCNAPACHKLSSQPDAPVVIAVRPQPQRPPLARYQSHLVRNFLATVLAIAGFSRSCHPLCFTSRL